MHKFQSCIDKWIIILASIASIMPPATMQPFTKRISALLSLLVFIIMLRTSRSRSGAGSKRRRQFTQQEMAERRNRLRFVREQRRNRTRAGVVSPVPPTVPLNNITTNTKGRLRWLQKLVSRNEREATDSLSSLCKRRYHSAQSTHWCTFSILSSAPHR